MTRRKQQALASALTMYALGATECAPKGPMRVSVAEVPRHNNEELAAKYCEERKARKAGNYKKRNKP